MNSKTVLVAVRLLGFLAALAMVGLVALSFVPDPVAVAETRTALVTILAGAVGAIAGLVRSTDE